MFEDKSKELIELLGQKNLTISFAESCTAGLLTATFCNVPGVSRYLGFSAVTYSDEFKKKLLGVPEELLDRCGAVSLECAREMALGMIEYSGSDMAVSVSGIAGPEGGTLEKPVGTVWIACAKKDGEYSVKRFLFSGDRQEIRIQTVSEALQAGIDFLKPRKIKLEGHS